MVKFWLKYQAYVHITHFDSFDIGFWCAMSSAKRPKTTRERYVEIASLGKASFITQSGMAKLIETLKSIGVPESSSRATQYRARKDICNTITPYGPLVRPVAVKLVGSDVPGSLGFQNPLAFLAYNCSQSVYYSSVVQDALALHPSTPETPWQIILYQDGVDPSDGLAKNHSRKSNVFYWSFAEFGMQALAHEEVWGTATIMRSTQCYTLEGALTQLTSRILEMFFDTPHDIMRTGVTVICCKDTPGDTAGSRATIFAFVGLILADAPAVKEITDWKGHSGHKCCILCKNATLAKVDNPMHLRSDYAVPITNPDFKCFELHTDESLTATVQRVHIHHQSWVDGKITKDTYEKFTQVLGFNWNPFNIVLNERFNIKLASTVMWDWGHCVVCDGIADAEMGSCMKSLQKSLSTYKELYEYASTFTFPKCQSMGVDRLLGESNSRNNLKKGVFSSSASEFLSLSPIFERYLKKVVSTRGVSMPQVSSMLAVLHVVVLLQAVKTLTVSSDALRIAIDTHLLLFLNAYTVEDVRPKHHYTLHLPEFLLRFGFLISTFTHERKHRLVKRYTRDRSNLKSWDLSAIEDITSHQLWELSRPVFRSGGMTRPSGLALTALRELFPTTPPSTFEVHTKIKCNGGSCSPGDVVAVAMDDGIHVGELIITVGFGDASLVSIVSLWESMGDMDEIGWKQHMVSESHVVKVSAESLDTVLLYNMSKERVSCLVYLPYELRG